jgi:hypothetical protein
MKLRSLTFTLSLLIAALFQTKVNAAPITLACSHDGEGYSVFFNPTLRTLIVNQREGYFDPQMVARPYYVKSVSSAGGGYRIKASGGEAGPHIIVFTGATKKVEYTESSFGWVFSTDFCS